MRLQTTPIGSATRSILEANCLATDTVGDAVRITGDTVSGKYQVTKVNIDVIPTMPAIGIIIRKTSTTACEVQVSGVVRDVYTGLTFHKRLFIDTTGKLIEGPPARPTTGFRAVQVMGVVLDATALLLDVESPIILRA
jgi:hypothetical protein